MNNFRGREDAYPDQIGATLHAFLSELQDTHHGFILNEVDFIKHCTELGAIKQQLQAGVIGAEQALTLMQELPVIEYCDDEGYGLDDSEIEMNMRVSASVKENKKDEGAVDSDTEVSASVGYGPFGHAKVSQKIHGHYSHAAEQAHEADYSAYTKLTVRLKRIKPPPARRLTSQLMQEYVRDIHEILKMQMKRQSAALNEELASKEPPKALPPKKDKKKGEQGESESDGFGSDNETDAESA